MKALLSISPAETGCFPFPDDDRDAATTSRPDRLGRSSIGEVYDEVVSGLEPLGPAVALCMVGESGFRLFPDAFEDSETSRLDQEVNFVPACTVMMVMAMMATMAMMGVHHVPWWGSHRRRERYRWKTFGNVLHALAESEPGENSRSLDIAS